MKPINRTILLFDRSYQVYFLVLRPVLDDFEQVFGAGVCLGQIEWR
ncbi:hypothetical protein QEH57_21820 [Pelagicoccus sp. SDUM812005]|nr:hypothetical protein [Pelagicoccus sp. SDUM812005]